MRADRLVAILLLLQQRGQVTAADVADELEVSERTARRDLEALGMAGLPVYSQPGRGGGWQLAGGGRTDLSGLNADEVRALFLVAGPSSSATPELRAALRKLVRALPEPFRVQAEVASSALVVDARPWDDRGVRRPPPPFLDDLQRAVVEGVQVVLGYVARDRSPSSRTVHPLGLVSKGSTWYLVAGTDAGLRTFRVDRISTLELTAERAERPGDFDLSETWRLIADEIDEKRMPLRVAALVDPARIGLVRLVLGTTMAIGGTAADGRITAEVRGYGARELAARVAGLGQWIEVLDDDVRSELRHVAAELQTLYAERR